ncbi:CDP-diacylglycerol--serine O-phosphatidyltransferase [Salsuginibacillus kocurii]|uniref:CDP-diacylglycerol--serine O-phosphatidyltransferase n=1 Tax=Salsuginibacillus kocurii TaxID=427078 RepID=UPI00035F6356|nr:CDP-diacylglycerol--serine O-phosphatidyltransferase [Salsuginibacillus kocurii]
MYWLYSFDETVKKIKSQAANALTILNLGLGALAIFYTFHHQIGLAILLITLAAVFDRLDGIVARKLDIVSDFGKQLDSLCDLISFGMAPAILVYMTALYEFGISGVFFGVLFIACGAIRLAKFNLMEENGYFIGLPITAAGSILTVSALLEGIIADVWFMILLFILAFLMIGPFRLKKM